MATSSHAGLVAAGLGCITVALLLWAFALPRNWQPPPEGTFATGVVAITPRTGGAAIVADPDAVVIWTYGLDALPALPDK